jgi:hypothetical protein
MIINSIVYGQTTDKTIDLTTTMNTEILLTDKGPLLLTYTANDSVHSQVATIHYINGQIDGGAILDNNQSEDWDVSTSITALSEPGLHSYKVIGLNYSQDTDDIEFQILYYPQAADMTFVLNDQGYYTLTSFDIGTETSVNLLPYGYTSEGGIRNVTVIGADLFALKNLTSVTLPSTIIKIEDNAFGNMSSLESLVVNSINPPVLGIDVFSNTELILTIYVPAASLIEYQAQ